MFSSLMPLENLLFSFFNKPRNQYTALRKHRANPKMFFTEPKNLNFKCLSLHPNWVCLCLINIVFLSFRMAAMVFQLMGLFLGIVGWCLESSSTNSAVWKKRSHGEAVVTASSHFEGLWISCASNSLGAVHCQKYNTILGLPGETGTRRARCGLRSHYIILHAGFSDTVSWWAYCGSILWQN